ncbi:reverse transcriptase [Cucumis melo var. makuwa]|uniref:Reverse transcriptase n=1 Tax=Cucumis melo var. makuwa TaxID=1194695 RepID=A0A5A7V7F6_CUCMM|nr:reverse transcriptase [Cucumis melo var. makuwa]
MRNLKKEVGSPTSQSLAPVQDFKPPRDQGMKNPIGPYINNTMNENDRFDVAVLKNVEEKNHGDEIEVRTETSNNEAEQGHTGKLDEYDPSLDIPISLRKVAKLNIVRILLSVTVNKYWPLYQPDVKNAYLKGDLMKEVYMSPSLGFDAQFGFEIKDLENLKYFLEMEVPRSKEGKLIYLSHTRLDISFAVGVVNQFMHAPYEKHMEVVNRIMGNLKNTPESLPPVIVPLFGAIL